MYRNTSFHVYSITDNNVMLLPDELKVHMVFKGNNSDTSVEAASERIWNEVSAAINDVYTDTTHGIQASYFRWIDADDNYKPYFKGSVDKVFEVTYKLGDPKTGLFHTLYIHYFTKNGDTLNTEALYHVYDDGPSNVDSTRDIYIPAKIELSKDLINKYSSGWKCIY